MKYCNNCKQNVEPVKKFDWSFFLLASVLLTPIIGIIYWMWYAGYKKKTLCPICGCEDWKGEEKPKKKHIQNKEGAAKETNYKNLWIVIIIIYIIFFIGMVVLFGV